MSRASEIEYIVIHCQAGNGTLESMQSFWKSKGWKSPGYSRWVDFDGTVHELASFEEITNGVSGFNQKSIHFSYRGGVENIGTIKKPIWKAKDTRTQRQKDALLKCIFDALNWLKDNGNDLQNVMILGHYQFSDDKNKNGVIESWERIKECPSFDAYEEYKAFFDDIINPNYHLLKLPKNR
ncbi:peptidoglycan recognition protein family protein [Flavobacterium sp. HNIBRBA15423]|uniref:peptidoglycan recognition protein family protein n=1 Tax=Flavobacterium sp. HNIBRBA15423 TaxID=3458683 RepID=UPI004044B108